MGMEDFWEQLPTGKEDKPLLFEMGSAGVRFS